MTDPLTKVSGFRMFMNTPENHYSGKGKEFNLPVWFSIMTLNSFSAWIVAHFEKRIFICYMEDSTNRHSKMPIELREEYSCIWKAMEKEERDKIIHRAVGRLDNFRDEAFGSRMLKVGHKIGEIETRRDPAIRNMTWDEIMFKSMFLFVPTDQVRAYNAYSKEKLKQLLERRICYQSMSSSTNFVFGSLTPNLKDAMKMERFCMNMMVMYLHDRYIQKNIDDLMEEESQEREVKRGKRKKKGGKAKARKKRKRQMKEREKKRRQMEEQLKQSKLAIREKEIGGTSTFVISYQIEEETAIQLQSKDIGSEIKNVKLDRDDFDRSGEMAELEVENVKQKEEMSIGDVKSGELEEKFLALRKGKQVTIEELRSMMPQREIARDERVIDMEQEEREEAEVTIERVTRPTRDEFMRELKANIREKGDKMGILVPLLADDRRHGYKPVEGVSWGEKGEQTEEDDNKQIVEPKEQPKSSKHKEEQQIAKQEPVTETEVPNSEKRNFAKRTPPIDQKPTQAEPQVQIEYTAKKTQKQIQKELAAEHIQRIIEQSRRGPLQTQEADNFAQNNKHNNFKGAMSVGGGSLTNQNLRKKMTQTQGSETKEGSVGTTGMTHFWDDAGLVSIRAESEYTEKVKVAVKKLEATVRPGEVRSESWKGANLFKEGSGEGVVASEGNKSVQTARFARERKSQQDEIKHFRASDLKEKVAKSKTESLKKRDSESSAKVVAQKEKHTSLSSQKNQILKVETKIEAEPSQNKEIEESTEKTTPFEKNKPIDLQNEPKVKIPEPLVTKKQTQQIQPNPPKKILKIPSNVQKPVENQKPKEPEVIAKIVKVKEPKRESKSECREKEKREKKEKKLREKKKKITLRKSKKGRRCKQNKNIQRQKLSGKGVNRNRIEERRKPERKPIQKTEQRNFTSGGNPNKEVKFWNAKSEVKKPMNLENVDENIQMKVAVDKDIAKTKGVSEGVKAECSKRENVEEALQAKEKRADQETIEKGKDQIPKERGEETIKKESHPVSKERVKKQESKQVPEQKIENLENKRTSKRKRSKEDKEGRKREKREEDSKQQASNAKTQNKTEKRKKKNKKRNKSENAGRKKRKLKGEKKEVRIITKIQTWDEVDDDKTDHNSVTQTNPISKEEDSKQEIKNEKLSQQNKEPSKMEKPTRPKKKSGKRKKGKNNVKGGKRGRDFKSGTWKEAEEGPPVVIQKKKKKFKSRLRKNCKPFEFPVKSKPENWSLDPYSRPYGYMGNPMMHPQSGSAFFQRRMNTSHFEGKTQGMMNDNSLSPIQNRPNPQVQFFGDFNSRRRATSNALNPNASPNSLVKNSPGPNFGSNKDLDLAGSRQNFGMAVSQNLTSMTPLLVQNLTKAEPGMTPNLNTLSLNMPPMMNLNSRSHELSNDLKSEPAVDTKDFSHQSLHRSHEPMALQSNPIRRDSDPFTLPNPRSQVHNSLHSEAKQSSLLNHKDFPLIKSQETLEMKLSRLVEEQQNKVHLMTERAFESFSHRSLMKIEDRLKDDADYLEPHRQIILERIQSIVLKSFRSDAIQVLPYGSYATKLLTPFSDLDLAITFTDYREVSHERTLQILNTLENNLGLFDFVLEKKNVSSASVPVIKIVADASVPYKELPQTASESRHIKVDIIVGSVDASGRANSAFLTTEVITNYIHNYPPFFSLALFFKYALGANNLSNAFGGGLSAYGMCLLLISFLYYDSQENSTELGESSLRFLHFLVHSFKPAMIAVNPVYVGYARDQVFTGMHSMMGCQLYVADPTSKIPKNVTPSCYRLYEVIDFFSKALDALLRARSFMALKLLRKLEETINKDIPAGARLRFQESNAQIPSDPVPPQAFSLRDLTQSSVVISQFDEKFKKNTQMNPRAEVLSHGPSPHFGAPQYQKVFPPVSNKCASYSVKVRSEAQFRLVSKSGLNISDNSPISQLPQEQALTATTNNTASKNQARKSADIKNKNLIFKNVKPGKKDPHSDCHLVQDPVSDSKKSQNPADQSPKSSKMNPQSAKKATSTDKYIFQSEEPVKLLSQDKFELLKSEKANSKVEAAEAKRKRHIERQIANLKDFKVDKKELVKLFEEFYPDLFNQAFNLTGKAREERSECESVGHGKLQNAMNFNAHCGADSKFFFILGLF